MLSRAASDIAMRGILAWVKDEASQGETNVVNHMEITSRSELHCRLHSPGHAQSMLLREPFVQS